MRLRRRQSGIEDYYPDDQNRTTSPRRAPAFFPHLILLIALIGGSLAAIHYFAGPEAFGRVLRNLANPVGVIWVLLFIASYWVCVWGVKLASLCCWTSWLILTLAGNSWVASQLTATLERPYLKTDVLQIDPLDTLLVLGGGTDTTPAGVPQLAFSGDRLATAARLYHAHKVKRFVVVGVRDQKLENEMDYCQESALILEGLGVPAKDITILNSGRNTAEELDAFQEWLAKSQAESPPQAVDAKAGGEVKKRTENEAVPDNSAKEPAPNESKGDSAEDSGVTEKKPSNDDATSTADPTTGANTNLGPMDSADKQTPERQASGTAGANRRVGVLTSAWHLPRTIQLAKDRQLDLIPVPSNYLTESIHGGIDQLLPNARNLWVVQIVVKEYAGRYWQ